MTSGTHQALPDARNEDVLVYVDGEFVPRAEATVSVFDSAFLVGDGVWEGFRLHQGRFVHLPKFGGLVAVIGPYSIFPDVEPDVRGDAV